MPEAPPIWWCYVKPRERPGRARLAARISTNFGDSQSWWSDSNKRVGCGSGFGPEEAVVVCRQPGESGYSWYGYVDDIGRGRDGRQ